MSVQSGTSTVGLAEPSIMSGSCLSYNQQQHSTADSSSLSIYTLCQRVMRN